jgi:hypothetical protein
MRTVSAEFGWMIFVPLRTGASGDFAPRSVRTGCPRISNESAGEPIAAQPGRG